MRARAAFSILAAVTASAAVSAVAFGQSSTWGGGAADAGSAEATPDAGTPPATQLSTWGGAAVPAAVAEAREEKDGGAPASDASTGDSPRLVDASAATDGGEDGGGGYTPSDVGFSVGLRAGYAVPFGSAVDTSLSEVSQGMVPVGIDVGWFFSPHFYAGAYFFYGFGVGANLNNDQCSAVDVSCTSKMIRLGVVAHYHFLPTHSWDPWVGGGLGYEALLNAGASTDGTSSTDLSSGTYGIDLSIEGVLDFKPLKYLGIGPYVELATGPYVSDSQGDALFKLHGWVTFGARLRTNL